ncbi:MAG: hypothetical protein CMJ18_07220 [Phycisphaeraceae bacterium]|nr:hypothetical protein [Phycisphaeraceae bacterium]
MEATRATEVTQPQNAWRPSSDQIASYQENGFLVVRGLFDALQLERFDRAILRRVRMPDCTSNREGVYPHPAKYTVAHEGLLDPGLAEVACSPVILDGAETLLGAPPVLKAFVSYLRTPGSTGSGTHFDYKPFRPVGSSVNWLFAILALTDYTEQIGPLLLSPGSHKCTTMEQRGPITHVTRAGRDDIPPMVDPNLKRGDLVFMHMFCWHKADANHSNQDRWGIYNKYMAADAPPGAGPFLFTDREHDMLDERGRGAMAYHSDRPIGATRLVLEHDGRILLTRQPEAAAWTLPGGHAESMDVRDGWDVGNVIGSLEKHVLEQTGCDLDWMTWVGDYDEADGLCRVYARPIAAPHAAEGTAECAWFSEDELNRGDVPLRIGFERAAIHSWLHEPKRRGIGLSQARAGLK